MLSVDPVKTSRAMNISTTSNSSSIDVRLYLFTQLATGISLVILSPITVISNLLLLLTIYKDPLKCFRTPASYLIIALGCVDFTTGLVIEPLFVAYRLTSYLKWSLYPGRSYESLLRIGSSISTVGLNLSFLLVLALIWSQFLAITHPQRYRSAITTRRILVFVGVSTLYFTAFTLLQFIGVSRRSLLQINLHFHATVITILLFVGSAILLRSLRRFAKESRQNEDDKGLRQLVVATLFLSAILIACSLAHIITLNIWFYTELETPQDTLHLLAAMTIADEMLFIKVAADAFVYAWRLPYYRKSLKLVLTRAGRQIGKEATEMVTMA